MRVDKHLCPQNHRCPAIFQCPVGAITQSGYSLPRIDDEKCIKCSRCTEFCPRQAIREE
jgi:ferredoxin